MKDFLEELQTNYQISLSDSEKELLLSVEDSEEGLKLKKDAIRISLSEIGLGKIAVMSILLKDELNKNEQLEKQIDKTVVSIINGLRRVDDLYKKSGVMETENFRKLLLTLAEDVRVVLIIIAQRLALIRYLNENEEDSDYRKEIGKETIYLYAPLAHRLGLYAIKTEMEDLSLKFTQYDIYKNIARTLNETKRHRDAYIDAFIAPLKKKLEDAGFKFSMKGRTKSINSIYRKMLKQNTTVEHIYDLFAIRIILDSEPEKEKADCWQVYSIITDMYLPNPKRLRDWLTIPKSNGYESLHTTVLGPENKWIEVQIRTRRMDEVAEKGVAAHWKYKGIQTESQSIDDFLKNVREMLENPNVETKDALSDFRLNFYEQEVFVFSPNGDLFKLPKGSTVLDFAFAIHTKLGCQCVGGKLGGRQVPIKYVLKNGDQVEILTSSTQKPNAQWLNLVHTSKARNKIRQALKDAEFKDAAEGKEMIERRFKNWKIDYDEVLVGKASKKLGFKTVSNLYQAIAQGKLDILRLRDTYTELQHPQETPAETISAENFVAQTEINTAKQDELVIDRNLKGVDYRLAKCCNPIFGDDIFGFVSIARGITIHRTDCPNATSMRERFGYRVVPARWSGKAVGQQYPVTFQVVGNDDIGIVTNISSIINKEQGVLLRTISIDSHDGLFDGHLTLLVSDLTQLENIRQKIAQVRGVKQVIRR
ncbi:MAG: bifunctional (p)ppGpp synthetase/guanosine-3',5'-bis(diphosphate) 3'-pyrophosphohydrolase [Paludibacteraceae bacterium]|nr:bifunctional (p)ppGpp synthetase/guanosine-3',5'-bis(diphosphate) 3'-pyrophosphohydrolase [Paludibacteraceae bacterium]